MNTPDWQKIERIIDQALELPENERATFIKERCAGDKKLKGEITLLLKSISSSEGWLEDPKDFKKELYRGISEDVQELSSIRSPIGRTVGSYIIKDKLGEGGMGEVYLAEHSDDELEHRVAIKIIRRERASAQNIRRFKRERSILAGLNHPGIAKLFDGGLTEDGSPYLIMEYIDGIPIDVYCQTQRCSLSDRIQLFKKILEAVRHAHENLVIHRDLKPGNILVDKAGNIKILDFGISKLLEDQEKHTQHLTQTGTRLLTPGYAAPEQIRQGNITTATDLYALGIVFYQMLSCSHPFNLDDLSPYETERVILEHDPPRPSELVSSTNLRKQISGDLDAIALKAIRKEPDQRYRVANEFLDDLYNYEQGLPVSAHEDTLQYNISKFIKRHKKGIGTASFVILMMISFGLFYTYQITQERNQAQEEANKAAQVTVFLMDLFEANDPTKALGDTITARELLERGVKRIETLQNQPKTQAQMFDVVGQVYRRLGKYDRSKELLERAVALRRRHYGPNHLETAASLDHLALLLSDMGAYQAADTLLRKSLGIRQSIFRNNHLSVATTQALWAYTLRRQGNYGRAEMLYRNSLDIRREQLGASHPLTLESISSLGATLHNQGKYHEAEKLFKEVLGRRKEMLGPSHPDIAMSLNNLAALLMNIGQFEKAETLLKESLAMRKKLFGSTHPKVALTMNNLALVLRDQGKYAAAEPLFQQALEMRTELLGPENIATAITLYSLAGLMLQTNRPDSALALYQQVLPVFYDKLSEEHSFTVRTWMGMGSAYLAKNDMAQAEYLLQKGFQKIRHIHPITSLERALAEHQMGALLLKQHQYDRADSLLSHAYRTLRAIEGSSSPRQQRILDLLHTLDNKMVTK